MSTYYKINKFTVILLFVLVFVPMFAFSDEAPDTGITYECVHTDSTGKKVYGECDFFDLVAATQKAVNWGVSFALFFSVVVIAYAGFTMLTSEGNPGKLTQAKKMFQNVAIGIAFVVAAWLIVNLITTSLLGKDLSTIFQ
jgi:hypothetical protein